MTGALRVLWTLPTAALAGPPLFLAVAVGLTAHHHRTRRTHR